MRYLAASKAAEAHLPDGCRVLASGEMISFELPWTFTPLVARLDASRSRRTPKRPRALEWVLLGGVVLYAVQAIYADDRAKAFEQVVFFYVPFALLFALLRGTPTALMEAMMALNFPKE